jgi:hypothetical protein
VRDGLDEIVDDVIDRIFNPGKWGEADREGSNPEEADKYANLVGC